MRAEGKGNRKCGSHSLLALHLNETIHHIHNILGDGHSQPGSLNLVDGGVFLPLEGFENVLYEFRTHTDSIILNGKFIIRVSLRGTGFLRDPHIDHTTRTCVFNRIAKQV